MALCIGLGPDTADRKHFSECWTHYDDETLTLGLVIPKLALGPPSRLHSRISRIGGVRTATALYGAMHRPFYGVAVHLQFVIATSKNDWLKTRQNVAEAAAVAC